MKLWLLGVRGSTPAPGAEFVRYGGHTSCIAVAADDSDLPTLVLDAGTGLRSLTGLLPALAFQGAILLTHLHWDHVQGIPFFVAGDQDASAVDLYLPAQDGRSARDLLADMMSPPSFPIPPEGLRGRWTFTALEPGELRIGDFSVAAVDIAHKGGRTYGYRVSDGTASIAYLPDHVPSAGCSDELLAMLHGVELLVHDAQFLEAERTIADLFGHATVDDAIRLAQDAEARELLLFHHGPARTDVALDEIAARVATAGLPVTVAVEGTVRGVRRP